MSDPNDPTSAPPPPPPTSYMSPDTSMGGGYPGPYVGPEASKDDRTMGMLCHLLAIFTGFIGPLVIWLIKKDTSPFVDDQGKESLNFQLTMLIGWLVAGATACFVVGLVLMPIILVVNIVFCIMGTLAANKGQPYRYPFNIRMIK